MKIRTWIAIRDLGDGSSTTYVFPTEKELRDRFNLDEDNFEPSGDIPIEIVERIIDINGYEVVEE